MQEDDDDMGFQIEWRPVVGYEGMYEVSNDGQVKSYKRKNHLGILLCPHVQRNGYLVYGLSRGGERKLCLAHRLVANAFIPNPLNLPQINHIDEDRTNNRVDNLEWCTAQYNLTYGVGARNRTISRSKPCIGIWPDGSEKLFESTTQAERETGISHSHICQVCNGIWKSAGGVAWRYVNDSDRRQ